jgi:hypothetical protein
MAVAVEDFFWESIGPNEDVGVFIHPYSKTDFTSFCIIVNLHSNQPSGAYTQIAAQMTDGATYEFFGDVARLIRVKNQTIGPQPYISVKLISLTQGI